jgi:hypothetical protein
VPVWYTGQRLNPFLGQRDVDATLLVRLVWAAERLVAAKVLLGSNDGVAQVKVEIISTSSSSEEESARP